jgi:endo-1,4-beta-xylanase
MVMAPAGRWFFWIAAALGTSCFAPTPASSGLPNEPAPAPISVTPETEAAAPRPKETAKEPLGSNPMPLFKLAAASEADAELSRVSVQGQPFSEAIQVTTKKRPAQPWDIQIGASTTAAVEKGDVMLATFYVRAVHSKQETGEIETAFVFERGSEPWTKSIEYKVSAGPEWKKFEVKFLAEESYEPGKAHALFRAGYPPQTMQIGNFTLVNYAKSKTLAELPSTSVTYPWLKPDAPWRKAAAERIDKIRQGNLTVEVVDAQGNPLAKAKVAVHQRRHSFGFGSAVAAQWLTDPGPNGDKYRETIKRLYNKVVFENDLKWSDYGWENLQNRKKTLLALKWLRDNKISVRGHNLVWPSWENSPKELRALKDDKAALKKRIEDHIREEVVALRGQIDEWDVVNEPFTNRDLLEVLGRDVMIDWFKIAHQADPGAKLFVNDYGILSGGGGDTGHQDGYEEIIKFLIQKGAPLDGIGEQSHFGNDLTAPDRLLKILDRFQALGKTLEITEHDIAIPDASLQAEYTRDFLTVVFSHPGVIGFLSWGFWEGQHWRPEGAYFRKDWSIKPAGQVLTDLITKEWRTDVEAETDAKGVCKVRGFLGDYEIVAQAQGRTTSVPATLTAKGTTARVVLK